MKTLLNQLLKALLGSLAREAVRIVADVALSEGTNAQKRKAAADQLRAAAKAKQVELKDGAVNLAIELAVAKLKR